MTTQVNPLSVLSIDYLRQLMIAIDKDFIKVIDIDGKINCDYSEYFVAYQSFLNYISVNKVLIKQGDKILNLSYGEMALILIRAEIRDRVNLERNIVS